jgi:hypothetical protein
MFAYCVCIFNLLRLYAGLDALWGVCVVRSRRSQIHLRAVRLTGWQHGKPGSVGGRAGDWLFGRYNWERETRFCRRERWFVKDRGCHSCSSHWSVVVLSHTVWALAPCSVLTTLIVLSLHPSPVSHPSARNRPLNHHTPILKPPHLVCPTRAPKPVDRSLIGMRLLHPPCVACFACVSVARTARSAATTRAVTSSLW